MNFGGDKKGASERVSKRDFLVGEKMTEAKGKRSERNGSLGGKNEHIVCITDCHGFSVNSI